MLFSDVDVVCLHMKENEMTWYGMVLCYAVILSWRLGYDYGLVYRRRVPFQRPTTSLLHFHQNCCFSASWLSSLDWLSSPLAK